ncbi:MAG: 16S rRNA (uracil(1498)-N(3))-methyltransferase [Planctomycetota bacterium]|nr:16S rRNA (uracil(1498)-N(3))-methyltransferase [Planctomycetota bacterium]
MASHSNPPRSRERRFFLDPLAPPETPRLAEQELHHALHVNRLGKGDRFWGLDGVGNAHLMEITAASRRELTLARLDGTRTSAAPGTPGSDLIHLELGLSLPKPGKAEEMLDRLTQLGVARVQPLIFHHSPEHARKTSSARAEKLQRASREAMKQCLRLWPMEIAEPLALEPWLQVQTPTVVLDPLAEKDLSEQLSALTAPGPMRFLVGPEGGLQPDEVLRATQCGATRAKLHGHVLRIETAAELAAGLTLQLCRPTPGH